MSDVIMKSYYKCFLSLKRPKQWKGKNITMMSNSKLMLLLELSGPKLVSIPSLSSISFQMTELFKSFTFLWI